MGANNKKLTQEYVEEFYDSRGCKLLDDYKNTDTKMRYMCKCGNERVTSFNKFKNQKHGCKICTGLEKYSQEFVEKLFEDNGCKLTSPYNGANNILKYICECGNPSTTTLSNFKKDKRCQLCGLKKLSDQFMFNLEYVRQIFIDGGCVPLFNEYLGSHIPLEYICECGSKSTISLSDFQYEKRCNNCRVGRIHKTMYSNGTQMCSTQQKFIHQIIGGELNYPFGNSTLDISFNDEKIYVEYDGSGHDLSVKLGSTTLDEFLKKEKSRRYALYRRGWKEIRIISKRDGIPSKSKITEMINYAKTILNYGRSWVIYDIDNGSIEYKNNKTFFNFGRLKRINKCDIS